MRYEAKKLRCRLSMQIALAVSSARIDISEHGLETRLLGDLKDCEGRDELLYMTFCFYFEFARKKDQNCRKQIDWRFFSLLICFIFGMYLAG